MNNTCKRLLSLVMAVVMVMSYGIVPVAAEDTVACTHENATETGSTAATCTDDGAKTFNCSSCGAEWTETITASGHSYTEEVTTAATCTAEGVKTFTCGNCGDTYTETVAATGHSYSETVTTAATCTTDGEKTVTCGTCGDTYTETVAATGHSYSEAVTTAATCTADGVKTFTCGTCGDSYTETIPAGHTYVDGACSACGAEEPHTHSYGEGAVTREATCTAEGELTFTCECGDTYTEAIEMLAHDYKDGKCACGELDYDYDWCGTLGCDVENNVHHAECPFGPCTLTPGCELVKGHLGDCTGMDTFDADNVTDEAALKLAIAEGGEIKLGASITTTSAIHFNKDTVIDLNHNTLTIGAGDNKVNGAQTKVTIKNGSICITGVTVGGNAIFCLNESAVELTLENVNLTGNGYSSAYGIFYIGAYSTLNVSGGEWDLANDTHTSGGIFKADYSSAKLNIDDLKLTAHNVRRIVTHATTTIEDSTMNISGDADGVDAEMEHGFNRSALTIQNSTITMKNMVGRGITAENGAVSIEGSTVTMENVQEATIQVNNDKTVTIDEDSKVTVDKKPTVASGAAISGTVSRSATGKFLSGMVNMENPDRTFLTLDFSNIYANESIEILIYDANDTLLVKTSLSNEKKEEIIKKDWGSFSSMVGINCTDDYWTTEWEKDKLRADYVPAYGVLYVDGIEQNRADIQMRKTSSEEAVEWPDVPGVKAAPKLTPVYTKAEGFWGEGWATSDESFVVELYEGETKIAAASLNNVGGIIDGDVYVTWSIPFAGSTDEYWTVEWAAGYPKYDMNPTKGVLVSDGEVVAESAVQYNAPDDLNKIVALAEGNTGGVVAYTSLTDAIGNFNGRKVNVLRDVTESISGFKGCTLTTNVEGGVTITDTNATDWIDFDDVTVCKGVTVNIPNVYSGDSENVIEGTLNVGETYYHGYDAKTTVQNGGKITVGESTILRYNESAGAGLYIYGDGDNSTVEFDCNYYIGAYSGTFYAESANIETGYFLLKNSYDDSNYADINMTLNGSSLKVVGTTDGQDSFIIDDQASLTLKNGSSIADVRDFNILEGTDLTLSVDSSSSIFATNVNIAADVPLEGTKNADGTVTFERKLQGTGTAEDPFLITCLEDLIQFRDNVNTYAQDGSNQYKNQYVKLTADIDLEGINWEPIGTNSAGDHMGFQGIFDGDGHTISNLYVNGDGDHLGFFARIGSYTEGVTPTVKNITFHNVDVSSNTTNGHGGSYVGGVIANAGGNSVVSGVNVTGDLYVSGYGYIGGIVGHGYPDISNCHVNVNDGSYVHAHYWCAGGIIGYAGEGGTPITNCSVSGLDIWSAYGAAAAVAGLLQDGNTVSNVSASNVEITSNSDYCMGYIAGNGEASSMSGVTINNVTATAKGEVISSTDAVATVGNTIYFNLREALDAADGKTVTLLKDVTVADQINIASGKTVTIDLNDKTLTGSIMAPNASLTVENGSIKNNDPAVSAIEINAGTLNLNDVNIESARHAVRIDGAVNATIDGGTYKSAIGNGTGTYHAVNVSKAANVTIEDGTFVGPNGTSADSGAAVNVQTGATVTIKGGDFSGGKNATLAADGTLTLTGGTYDQDPTEFCAKGYGPVLSDGKYVVTVLPASGDDTFTSLDEALGDEVSSVKIPENPSFEQFKEVNGEHKDYPKALSIDANGNVITGIGYISGDNAIAINNLTAKNHDVLMPDGGKVSFAENGTATFTPNFLEDEGYGRVTVTDKNGKTRYFYLDSNVSLTVAANGALNDSDKHIIEGNKNGPTYNIQTEQNTLHDREHYINKDPNMIVYCNGFYGSIEKIWITGGQYGTNRLYIYENGKEQVDDIEVDPGCTIVTLKKDYLNDLDVDDDYYIHFQYMNHGKNDSVSTRFKVLTTSSSVADETNPKTGDFIMMPMAIMTLSAAALAVLLIGKKKHA